MKKTSKDMDTNSDPKLPKDTKPKAERKCGGKCIAETICKDVFNGQCAMEIMTQAMDRPGTSDSEPKGKPKY